jgi:hypothetical protein
MPHRMASEVRSRMGQWLSYREALSRALGVAETGGSDAEKPESETTTSLALHAQATPIAHKCRSKHCPNRHAPPASVLRPPQTDNGT